LAWSPPKQPLEPEKLAALLDRLVGEVKTLATQEQAIQSEIVRQRRAEFMSSAQSLRLDFDPQQKDALDSEDKASRCEVPPISFRDLTFCFLRLSNVVNGAFERLGRYNAALWKQTAQTPFLLQTVRQRQL
jgi:hypothetical protein